MSVSHHDAVQLGERFGLGLAELAGLAALSSFVDAALAGVGEGHPEIAADHPASARPTARGSVG